MVKNDYNHYTNKIEPFEEVIHKGSFHKSIVNNVEVIGTIDHDKKQTFAYKSRGELLLQEDDIGLFCSSWLPENEVGELVLEAQSNGELRGASFWAKSAPSDKWTRSRCEVFEAELIDVCVCLKRNAVNPDTRDKIRAKMIQDYFNDIKIIEYQHKYRK